LGSFALGNQLFTLGQPVTLLLCQQLDPGFASG